MIVTFSFCVLCRNKTRIPADPEIGQHRRRVDSLPYHVTRGYYALLCYTMTIVVVILFDLIISKMLKLQPEINNKNI